MRVIVATHHHFSMLPDGTIFPYAGQDYKFFSRYLNVFDEVVVFSRVKRASAINQTHLPSKSTGPGVTFFPVSDFIGARGYLKHYSELSVAAKGVLQENDACILRIPSHVCTVLWRELMRKKRPYGVEVICDPWQGLSPGSHKSILRPVLRLKGTWDTIRQCRNAATAAYVTEFALQKRCPAGGWSTHYSSVELLEEVIIDETAFHRRIERVKSKAKSNGPWRLCFAGSLWHLAKSPDILIAAVADCIKKGINIELMMIGSGSFQPQLEKQARLLGIADSVVFLGQLPPGKVIYDQMDQADLYVLPSRSEGLPRSLIEAMARGLPCLASNVGGIPELLASEDLVPPGVVATLAAKIESVIRNPDRLEKMGRRNLQTVEKYRSDKLNRRRIEHYERLKEATEAYISSKRR